MFKKLMVAMSALAVTVSMAMADIVELDGTGAVTFNPSELVTPISTAIIATITAVASIFVIVIGLRWMIRLIKGAK